MALFAYVALNNKGQEVKAEVEAASSADALSKIRGLGYFPTSIKEKRGGGKGSTAATASTAGTAAAAAAPRGFNIPLFGGRVRSKELTLFTRQLSTLQDAGLPIVRSIKILEGQLKPCKLKQILVDVADSVESGSSFSEALARYPRAFSKLYVNMVRAGEAGGVLDTILQRLADFLEKSEKLRRKIKAALIYPSVVITIAFMILTAILLFVIPQFEKVFLDLEVGVLPFMTRALLGLSKFVVHWWFLVVIGLPIAAIVAVQAIGRHPQGRYYVDYVKLKVPLMGTLVNKTVIARFTRTLGTLIASGVPILEALSIVREAAGNEVIGQAFGKIHDSIREGESIAEPLASANICDAMVVNMIDVGEETGELDKMLMKIADKYDDEVDTAVEGLMSAFEPLLIVFIGLVIGFIVIALFMPLIKLMNSMSTSH